MVSDGLDANAAAAAAAAGASSAAGVAAAAALGKFLEAAEALLETLALEAGEDPRVVLGRPPKLFPLALPSMTRLLRPLLLFSDPRVAAVRLLADRFSLAAMAASMTVSKALRRVMAAFAGCIPLRISEMRTAFTVS